MANMMRGVLRSLLVVSLVAGSAYAADEAPAQPAAASTMKAKHHHKSKTKKARKAKVRHKAHHKTTK
jgi:Ni/Co efflux regulator RcnB